MTTQDLDAIRGRARQLAEDIDELVEWWDFVEEADTHLGAEVQDKGERLMLLAGELAGITADASQADELRQLATRLGEAIDYYGALDEHDTNASIDIFAQLGTGIARVLKIAKAKDTGCRPDGGQLVLSGGVS